MPVVDDEVLRNLLGRQEISHFTIDTSSLEQKGYQFESGVLERFSQFKTREFKFILSDTIQKEILSHLCKDSDEAARDLKKSLGLVLNRWNITHPSRDELISHCTNNQTSEEASTQRLNAFLNNSECEVLVDATRVNPQTVLDAFFAATPPFGTGEKKSEFPDAFALLSLENFAEEHDAKLIVVSNDGDWQKYCELSPRLYYVSKIEHALSLIQDTPVVLVELIKSEIGEEDKSEFWADINSELGSAVYDIIFDLNADAPSELQASTWGQELVRWAIDDEQIIDVVDVVEIDEHSKEIYVSLPLILDIDIQVELEFSVWDSIDRDSVSLGSRSIEHALDLRTKCILRLNLHDEDDDARSIEFVDLDLERRLVSVNLGYFEVYEHQEDIFEPDM